MSERNARLPSPRLSRLPAGFHAFFAPLNGKALEYDSSSSYRCLRVLNVFSVPLCDFFHELLGDEIGKCHSIADSFSRPEVLPQRTPLYPTYQYYSLSPITRNLERLFLSKVCDGKDPALESCNALAKALDSAIYVDVDSEAADETLTLTFLWESADSGDGGATARMKRSVRKPREDDRVEVGVLQAEKSDEVDELSFGGYLTVLGESDHPSMVSHLRA